MGDCNSKVDQGQREATKEGEPGQGTHLEPDDTRYCADVVVHALLKARRREALVLNARRLRFPLRLRDGLVVEVGVVGLLQKGRSVAVAPQNIAGAYTVRVVGVAWVAVGVVVHGREEDR